MTDFMKVGIKVCWHQPESGVATRHTAVETPATRCSNALPVEHNTLCNAHIWLQCASGKAVSVRTRNTKRSAARNVSV